MRREDDDVYLFVIARSHDDAIQTVSATIVRTASPSLVLTAALRVAQAERVELR
jgi:hypothetical protein